MANFGTSRMILKKCPGEDQVSELAASKDWAIIALPAGRARTSTNEAAAWDAGHHVILKYYEDNLSSNCWITVEGDTSEDVSGIAAEAYEALSPWSLEDLAAQVDHARNTILLGQAIIRLGIAAPYEYDEWVFERIAAGLRHRKTEVRDMSIWSTTYSPYAQYRPVLSEIAEHDRVQKLRERARLTLQAFDAGGVE